MGFEVRNLRTEDDDGVRRRRQCKVFLTWEANRMVDEMRVSIQNSMKDRYVERSEIMETAVRRLYEVWKTKAASGAPVRRM